MEHDVIPSCHTITVNYGTRRKPLNVKIHRYELRNRVLHREDGPAIEWVVGTKEWYLNGSEYTEKNWKLEIEKLKINFWSEVPSNFTGIAEIAGEAKQWFKNGLWHREDGPAIEWANGVKWWYKEGKYHREDGPAIESLNGHKEWYKNGKCHREDGPAVERLDRSKFWYKYDKLRRIDGPACEYSNGDKHWYKEDKLHRDNGPAIEWASGRKEWWIDGKRHRDNGPAIEWANGDKEWWINHLRYSEEEWKFKVQELKSPKMETLKIKSSAEIPKNFTGIVEFPSGKNEWYKEGKLHRENGPAVVFSDGTKHWFKEGNLHREDGPACEWSDGTKHWYKEGKRHRENGPAVEYYHGSKFWYKEGHLHREDGPACEYSSGHKEWWIKGKRVSKVENILIESKLNAQKTRPSKSRQVAIRVASRQVIKSISALITKTLTKGFKASDSQKLNSWFKSEAGSAVLMVLVGKILPRFEILLPEEYKPLFSEIAEEIEIETMVDLTDGIIDSIAAAMVSFDFNSFQFFNSESEAVENVRVETLSAPTVTPWESVAVAPVS